MEQTLAKSVIQSSNTTTTTTQQEQFGRFTKISFTVAYVSLTVTLKSAVYVLGQSSSLPFLFFLS
jgi:hypothetical protein